MKICMSVDFDNDERKVLTKLLGSVSPYQLKEDFDFNPGEITIMERVFVDFCGLPEEEIENVRHGFGNKTE